MMRLDPPGIPSLSLGLILAVVLAPAAQAAAAEKVLEYSGAALFKTYCASCHGPNGKGDGPLADSLRVRPQDLQQFAKRNDGTFPAEKAYRIIDGREPVKGHGGGDMPVWGDAFKSSHEGYSEEAVKARIKALVSYLESVQD